jgi:hypothetical protein
MNAPRIRHNRPDKFAFPQLLYSSRTCGFTRRTLFVTPSSAKLNGGSLRENCVRHACQLIQLSKNWAGCGLSPGQGAQNGATARARQPLHSASYSR